MNARHAEDAAPLDAESNCAAARDYSRAYRIICSRPAKSSA